MTVVRFHWRSPLLLFKTLAAIPITIHYAYLMNRQKIAHLHIHWANVPTTLGWFINRITKIPYSFTAHAFDIFLNNPMLTKKIESAKFVFTCTDYNRKYLQSLVQQPDKIILNYHGIDLATLPTAKKNELKFSHKIFYRLLSIGRLKEQKGFTYLIESCQLLKKKGINFQCKIVGQGPQRIQLEKLINKFQLKEDVQLVGLKTQEEVYQLYQWADIFVLPCVIARDGDRDGIPNVLIEALALNLPVVSTSVSGVPEIIKDGTTGLLAQPRNSQDFSDKIELLLNDSPLQKQFVENGRKWVEQTFTIQKNVKQMAKIFTNQLLDLKKIKVIHIIDEFIAAGAQQLLVDLLRNMDKSRYKFTTIALLDQGVLKDEVVKAGSDLKIFNKKPGVDFQLLIQLCRYLNQVDVDIIHTHLFSAGLWGRLAAIVCRVPVIVHTEHNITSWKNMPRKLLDNWLSRFTNRIIAVSKDAENSLIQIEKIAPAKIKLIKNGIDFFRLNNASADLINKEFQITNGDAIVGIVAGLNDKKGHEYFIEAAARILKRRNGVKFFIIGDGALHVSLKELVIQQQLTTRVIFTGVRRDIHNFLSRMNVFVLSSIREGLPLSLLEAMWMKVPAVVTKVGGMPEVICSGKTGLLVQPKNSKALAQAIEQMLDHPQEAQKMAERAFALVKNKFSVEAMVEDYDQLYIDEIKTSKQQINYLLKKLR